MCTLISLPRRLAPLALAFALSATPAALAAQAAPPDAAASGPLY